MKSIAFLNIKGGVGKTTSVTTIAHMLATQYKKRVLLSILTRKEIVQPCFLKQIYLRILSIRNYPTWSIQLVIC